MYLSTDKSEVFSAIVNRKHNLFSFSLLTFSTLSIHDNWYAVIRDFVTANVVRSSHASGEKQVDWPHGHHLAEISTVRSFMQSHTPSTATSQYYLHNSGRYALFSRATKWKRCGCLNLLTLRLNYVILKRIVKLYSKHGTFVTVSNESWAKGIF